jgi:hypothetical protein
METLQLLGTALGLTAMAGLNLYLTVFVTGLAIRMGWLQLAGHLPGLEILANPVVLTVAGVLLAVELIIDKWPYADNGWDAIHTIIRPVGGALLALSALGHVDPVVSVIGALLGGSVALTTHSAKAGSRLMINLSPEPATNIAASVTEDVLVLGGLWLAFRHPIITLTAVASFTAMFWYCSPRFFRMVKANGIGIVQRFSARRHPAQGKMPAELPGYARETWLTLQHAEETVNWAVPCFTGKMKPLGRNVRGWLFATSAGRMFFIGRRNLQVRLIEVPLAGARWTDDPGAVFHRVAVPTGDGQMLRFRFTRKFSGFVPAIMESKVPVLTTQLVPG